LLLLSGRRAVGKIRAKSVIVGRPIGGVGLRVRTCLWVVLGDTDSFFENNQQPAG
jgi:hypothetical protein